MAASHHTRSNSSPSAPHPLDHEVDNCLNRLRSCSSASTSINQSLNSVNDLYALAENLLQLPSVCQALSQEQCNFEARLEGLVRLLDVCNVVKDSLSQTKESLQEIQSCMRRKKDVEIEAKKFLASRKSLRKALSKAVESLSVADVKQAHSNHNEPLSVLSEAESVTVSAYHSIFRFILASNFQEKGRSKWWLATRLINQKSFATSKKLVRGTEFANLDAALRSWLTEKPGKSLKPQDLLCLEICIQDIEHGVERLFRSLIKTRVAILNIFIHCN